MIEFEKFSSLAKIMRVFCLFVCLLVFKLFSALKKSLDDLAVVARIYPQNLLQSLSLSEEKLFLSSLSNRVLLSKDFVTSVLLFH